MRSASVLAATVLVLTTACVPPPEPPDTGPPDITSFGAPGAPHVDPALVPLAWTVADPDGDDLSCRLDGDGDGTWDHTLTPCPLTGSRNVRVPAGAYTARLEVSDGTHTTSATVGYDVAPDVVTEGFDLEIRPSTPLDADLVAAFEWAAARWESAVVRGLSDMAVTLPPGQCSVGSAAYDGVVDDIVVDVSVQPIPGYAGLGGPCVFGPDYLPRYGAVQVNPESIPFLRAAGVLDELALHELAHVLGFGTIWNYNRSLVAATGTPDSRFIGPRASAEYSALGGVGGIPTDTVGGIDTGHWHPDLIGSEVMTPGLGGVDGAPLSSMTIASMADLGYRVDRDVADPYTLPVTPTARRTATSLRDLAVAPLG